MDSKGHLFNTDKFEFFKSGDIVYRAPIDCPIDINGYRMGARFECYEHHIPMLDKIYPKVV